MATLAVPPALVPAETRAGIARLRGFVTNLAELVSATRDETEILQTGSKLLARLIAQDDWLPPAFAIPHPERYQQYLLHCDSRERFSVVSFVWAPGQGTPIHDHRVWGLVGVLRGAETSERFARQSDGSLKADGPAQLLRAGEVEAVSPRVGDIHRVRNARADGPSVSIHVYGANIGAVERATYALDGTAKRFVSGYASSMVPNLWDRSQNP
ncbi:MULTISPECIES: cysteine dioxygenase [unclassified Novosphingobium]|uniref:cysteine dioxygenase family protein n=1 Tax=unclassified Novosphingobium TaxID=2644732 RepID=UPI00146B5A2E|nr:MULTISPECIES: cysteine dioxygenase [unclassified Novosphingobium]NMN05361.1 putative metal-dependent enzyme (double-stranded beta helix superfamily) [Novosphingobium sp. SG919]NMN87656.1 putative metal-dependent enzyme (double-stranded beta helix superfamily) [Novosphingobium sp. SG916]